MITDEIYNELSTKVYWIDTNHKKYNPDLKEDSEYNFGGKEFKILKIEDDPENGMQAMAVAPLDKNGNEDTSEIVIAYAGTNFKDIRDLSTDVQTVVLGKDGLSYSKISPHVNNSAGSYTSTTINTNGQSVTALDFAKEIKKLYPNAVISTTGHSLGEYLALLVAAENKWLNVGFNGPDPYGILSDEAKKWIKNNPGWLNNYRNRYDIIGNSMGNGTGAEIKIDMEMGVHLNIVDYHKLEGWEFKNGKLIIPENDYNKKATLKRAENELLKQFALSVYSLSVIKAKFQSSGGGISANEQIYLDDRLAQMIVDTASQTIDVGVNILTNLYEKAIEDAENLWQKTLSKAYQVAPDLSHSEILDALNSRGANENSIVGEPSRKYQEKISQVKQLKSKFDALAQQIQSKINELVQKDQELARQIN